MQIKSFRFNIQELGGAVGDLGTLLPLMVALILINGVDATIALIGIGLFYIISAVYFKIPIPVQPLKAVSTVAIAMGLGTSIIGAAGLLMGLILLLLSVTNLIKYVVKLFPQAVVRGIQLSIAIILFRRGIEFIFDDHIFLNQVGVTTSNYEFPLGVILALSSLAMFLLFKYFFFRQTQWIPPSLVLLTFGLGVGIPLSPMILIKQTSLSIPAIALPSPSDFWLALTLLVIPQLPLTLGNAVVGTSSTAKDYFGEQANRVTPQALTTSMGIANLVAGLFGAIPMCHGSGGLTAHYKLGARTGAAGLMIGGLLITLGLVFGSSALPVLSMIPKAVLGVFLVIVGIYHGLLIKDLNTKEQLVVAATVAVLTLVAGNLAMGFAGGILLHHGFRLLRRTGYKNLQSNLVLSGKFQQVMKIFETKLPSINKQISLYFARKRNPTSLTVK